MAQRRHGWLRGFKADALGDLDDDGDLDALIAAEGYSQFWDNTSNARFEYRGFFLRDHIAHDVALGDLDDDGDLDAIVAAYGANKVVVNMDAQGTIAGDANRDGQFDQYDIVQVLQADTYLPSNKLASWSEGDWNGDSLFTQLDLILALLTGRYMQRP